MEDKVNMEKTTNLSEHDYLTYGSSLSQGFVHFNPKETAVLGLTAMIKVLAQTKNLRRGHDAQGRLKRVRIDQTNEGYANFIAPMRMKKIAYDVEQAKKSAKQAKMTAAEAKKQEDLAKIFDVRVLKPSTETYLTAEWDEMVPFPTSKLFHFFYVYKLPTTPLYKVIFTNSSTPLQHGKSVSMATAPAITVSTSPCFSKMNSPTTSRHSTSLRVPVIMEVRLVTSLIWWVGRSRCQRRRRRIR